MRGRVLWIAAAAGIAACGGAQQMTSEWRSELAPRGVLRAGINFGNTVLANRDESGAPHGIAADLAREIARRIDTPVEFVAYDTAGRLADGAKAGAWDIAFLAADPDRAGEIAFTPPYLEMDATYLVPAGSMLRNVEDVDREGIRIAVSEKSAYDLFLSRNLKHARLVRTPGVRASVDLFVAEQLDALAGIRPLLLETAQEHPGSRVLDGRYTAVHQAIGAPKGRDAALKHLSAFIAEAKASGWIAERIERNGIRGVSVAP